MIDSIRGSEFYYSRFSPIPGFKFSLPDEVYDLCSDVGVFEELQYTQLRSRISYRNATMLFLTWPEMFIVACDCHSMRKCPSSFSERRYHI